MKKFSLILAAATMVAAPAMAQDFSAELKARQGQFRIMALNLGVLGGMAQGKIDYDADAAQEAADTLVAVSMISQTPPLARRVGQFRARRHPCPARDLGEHRRFPVEMVRFRRSGAGHADRDRQRGRGDRPGAAPGWRHLLGLP